MFFGLFAAFLVQHLYKNFRFLLFCVVRPHHKNLVNHCIIKKIRPVILVNKISKMLNLVTSVKYTHLEGVCTITVTYSLNCF